LENLFQPLGRRERPIQQIRKSRQRKRQPERRQNDKPGDAGAASVDGGGGVLAAVWFWCETPWRPPRGARSLANAKAVFGGAGGFGAGAMTAGRTAERPHRQRPCRNSGGVPFRIERGVDRSPRQDQA